MSAVSQTWFEMSIRAQKAITCLFDPDLLGKYIGSEDFRVSGRRVTEERVLAAKKQLKQSH